MPFQMDYFILNFFVFISIFLLLDFLIFFMIKQKVNWVNIIISSVVYFVILFIIFIFLIKKVTLHNFFGYISSELTVNFKNFLQGEKIKELSAEEIENLKLFFDFFIVKMILAYIFVFFLLVSFLNYYVMRLFMITKYKIINEMPKFRTWYLNEKVVWVLIFTLLLIALKNFLNNDIIYTFAINIMFVLANLYFLIGLSLTFFFMEKYKIPFWGRFFFVFIIILWSHLSFIIMLTGVLDTWFNLRKIQKGGNMI